MSLHFLDILDFSFPISDPVLKFLIILVVILVIPILSDRLRLPHLLGMILAGVVIGPYGLNLLVFPRIARWFFKRYNDSVSQYIFVLVIVFLGAIFSQWAGIEGIIGAFMAGLALNRLIPIFSPLMNRVNFVGNAIFIPFFLIGVGMLIDYRAFGDVQTLLVAFIMSAIATFATQRGAQSIAYSDQAHNTPSDVPERILIPISNPNTLEELINISTYIYHPHQPIATIRRHFVLIPEKAEQETGFSFWLAKIWNMALNTY